MNQTTTNFTQPNPPHDEVEIPIEFRNYVTFVNDNVKRTISTPPGKKVKLFLPPLQVKTTQRPLSGRTRRLLNRKKAALSLNPARTKARMNQRAAALTLFSDP